MMHPYIYTYAHAYLHTKTSVDVLPSKNQASCEYCTQVTISFNTVNTLISPFPLLVSHMRRDSSLSNIAMRLNFVFKKAFHY